MWLKKNGLFKKNQQNKMHYYKRTESISFMSCVYSKAYQGRTKNTLTKIFTTMSDINGVKK